MRVEESFSKGLAQRFLRLWCVVDGRYVCPRWQENAHLLGTQQHPGHHHHQLKPAAAHHSDTLFKEPLEGESGAWSLEHAWSIVCVLQAHRPITLLKRISK